MLGNDEGLTAPPWTRPLSESEARTVSSLLGASLESEESRIRDAQIPRTTYREAKRRLFDAGILEHRYIPHPEILGVQRVTLLVSRPHSDRMAATVRALSGTPGAITVWSGMQLAFALVFHRSIDESEAFMSAVNREAFGPPVSSIELDPREPRFPVFFDFEGAWNHFCNLRGTVRYPRPLLGAVALRPKPRAAGRIRDIASTLMGRPFLPQELRLPPHLLGPATLPREERRLIRDGAVDWRIILQLDRQIAHNGREVSSVIFILGRLRSGRTLPGLFHALAGECGVAPFLLAGDESKVLMIGLGTGEVGRSRALNGPFRQRAVRPTLREHLESFDSLREPVSSLRIHRFLHFGDPPPNPLDGGAKSGLHPGS